MCNILLFKVTDPNSGVHHLHRGWSTVVCHNTDVNALKDDNHLPSDMENEWESLKPFFLSILTHYLVIIQINTILQCNVVDVFSSIKYTLLFLFIGSPDKLKELLKFWTGREWRAPPVPKRRPDGAGGPWDATHVVNLLRNPEASCSLCHVWGLCSWPEKTKQKNTSWMFAFICDCKICNNH